MNRAFVLALAAAVAGPAVVSPARAQTIDHAAMAEVLFDEGRRLVGAGRFAEGCMKFAESERLDHGVGTLLNLADCYERAGMLASAWTQFRAAAAAAAGAGQPDREAIAQERILALTPSLQRLAVRVPPGNAALPEFEIRRDDIKLDRSLWGVAVPLDPGPHRLEARAAGKKTWSIVVDVPAKRGTLVTQTVPKLEDPAADGSATPMTPGNAAVDASAGVDGRKVAALTLFGGAAAGAILGGIFGVRALSLNGTSNDHCVQNRCDQSGFDTRNEARTSGTVSTVAFVAAGALAAGGAAILLFSRSPKDENAAALALSPGPGGGGLVARGTF